jgi:hypothetical protein
LLRGERGKLPALQVEKLNCTIAKQLYEQLGQSSERGTVLGQPELQLFELEWERPNTRPLRSWRGAGIDPLADRSPSIPPPKP